MKCEQLTAVTSFVKEDARGSGGRRARECPVVCEEGQKHKKTSAKSQKKRRSFLRIMALSLLNYFFWDLPGMLKSVVASIGFLGRDCIFFAEKSQRYRHL
jgi:hypothetical protein